MTCFIFYREQSKKFCDWIPGFDLNDSFDSYEQLAFVLTDNPLVYQHNSESFLHLTFALSDFHEFFIFIFPYVLQTCLPFYIQRMLLVYRSVCPYSCASHKTFYKIFGSNRCCDFINNLTNYLPTEVLPFLSTDINFHFEVLYY